jgi:predicted AAA+ superfamily ATPase
VDRPAVDGAGDLLERLDRIARALEARAEPAPAASRPPLGRAFSWSPSGGFRPVRRLSTVAPELLIGIDRQKEALYGNVRRFLSAVPAHDALLWGERGTGKSSLVRSLLAAFEAESLSLVEVAEAHIPRVPDLLDTLEPDPRRWILFLDDLSFAGAGDHYRELKVLLEGGLEARPENTLIVATSNRRHLVPESFAHPDEIHPEEAVAEAVSLADRFGLSLGFYAFDEATYLGAVGRHLEALGAELPIDAWRPQALRWAMGRGLRSGRAALQAAKEIAAERLLQGAP